MCKSNLYILFGESVHIPAALGRGERAKGHVSPGNAQIQSSNTQIYDSKKSVFSGKGATSSLRELVLLSYPVTTQCSGICGGRLDERQNLCVSTWHEEGTWESSAGRFGGGITR